MDQWLAPGALLGVFTLLFAVYARITEQRIRITEDRLNDHSHRLEACESARESLVLEKGELTRQLMDTMIKLADALKNATQIGAGK